MRTQSPWSTIASAVFLLGFALWFFHSAYAPPDSTPLHLVEGSIGIVSTTWIHHSSKVSHWSSPIVTITTADGPSIRFTAHSQKETPAVLSVANLRQGSALRAQVDASGEIWEMSANENEVVPLADTLERHHELMHRRNLVCGFMLVLGVVSGVFGYKRLQAASDLG